MSQSSDELFCAFRGRSTDHDPSSSSHKRSVPGEYRLKTDRHNVFWQDAALSGTAGG